ncbi:uncharacterized protein PV09_01672 [Verruconis gallopava]|uniref:HAD hydrolase, family IA n=1 Tax=Verruconis gallopava TaxID=253628 RepID=A0A0D1Z436_9PEZI|nr:uncharacterized protein PV09_01672 [Verruconis gallopava]KIW07742.1 hypothetical protein PV09_01672 [Verruconis gallopava]
MNVFPFRPAVAAVHLHLRTHTRTRTMGSYRVRKFAPLNPEKPAAADIPKLEGIIFDVDGTLCEPQNYMFQEMRDALGISKATDILEHVHSLPDGEQEAAMEKIKAIERRAMKDQKPQPGLTDLMSYLERRGIQKAICTRNFDLPIEHLLTSFLPDHKFEPIITRAFKPPKPSPAGINHIAQSWNLRSASNCIMVGDSIDDMTAGHSAGAATVLLVNPVNEHLASHDHTDLCISRLDELIQILEEGFVGREEVSEDEAAKGKPKLAGGAKIKGGPDKIIGVLKSAGRDPSQLSKSG